MAKSNFTTCVTLWLLRKNCISVARRSACTWPSPPLSQQIRKLEAIVGTPLFTRTSLAVKLTAAGEVFLERARRNLRNVQEDLEEARSLSRGEAGFLGFLRDGGPAEGLSVTTLFSEPFVATVPAGHPLTQRNSITAASLRDEPFVFFPANAGTRAYEKPVSLCEQYGFRPRVVQEAPQWLTLLRLVGAGLGVTIAPACAGQIATPDVVCLKLRNAAVQQTIARLSELSWVSLPGRYTGNQRKPRARLWGVGSPAREPRN